MATAGVAAESPGRRDVDLVITDAGTYLLAGQPVAFSQLRATLQALKAQGGPVALHVRGGPKVNFAHVGRAMQIVQEEGLAPLSFITVAPAAPHQSSSGAGR